MKGSILIIQPVCPEYRIPFFKALANRLGHIAILHFGDHDVFSFCQNIKEFRGEKKEVRSINFIMDFKKHIKDYNIIVGMFDPHWLNVFILPISHKKKVIFWGHGLGKSGLINVFRGYLARKAEAIITYSDTGKRALVAKGVESTKIFIAPNTIDVQNAQDTSNEEKNAILFVGRLQQRKELVLLLNAFHHLKLFKKGIRLIIVGNGEPEKSRLVSIIHTLNIGPYVDLIDGTNDESILKDFFKRAFVYVSPGAVGLGVLHSFAYGVPVITFSDKQHGPEVGNIINGITGITANSYEEFCMCLVEITSGILHRKLGQHAYRHYVEKRAMHLMVNGFVDAVKYVV